ncbi:integrase, catalytic region, zinc finger, CCHC-type containing protein [Tanacetum coccineum]|uniref:Integrase, catalytic region, zinc finger, CCHC-type containing protein n=1 Tax=Tanacetum coccineum TaxID=301880 RepID=A0ABQ4YUF5_9ASTR
MLLVQAQESGQVLDEEQLAFLADPRVADGQATQTIITHNAAFQTDDLDAYDSNYDDISSARAVLMANLSSYDSDVLSEVPHFDTYQNDDMINHKLNKLSKDFGKRFVPNKKLSAEQAFWLPLLNPISEQLVVPHTPIKKVLLEVIPILNSLRESFKDFDNGLHNEINEAVEQCSVDKKCFEIQKKYFYLKNDRLLEHIIYQDVMNIGMHVDSVPVNVLPAINKYIVHICVNSLATRTNCHEMRQSFIDAYNETLELKAQLAKKEHMVEKTVLNEVVLICSRFENRCVNLELKIQHQKEIFLNNRPLNNQDAPEIQEFFHINEWQAKLKAKDVSIANLKKHIENLKGKNVVEKDAPPNNANVIAPRMFRLDLEPLAPKLLKIRDAHIDYIKHTQEHADTLQEIVEHARALRLLDSDLDSACNTKTNRISRTTSSNQKNKVEDHPRSVKSSSNKKNRVIEPVCNANVKHSMLNANSELIYATCNECMFDAIHDLCFLDFINDVNVCSKSKSAKRRKNKTTLKPTGKIFTSVGYRWLPTGWTFTIDGKTCPLTRITSTSIVPPKETSLTPVTIPNPAIKIYRRRTKVAKLVVQIILWYMDSGCSKHMTKNRSQLINFVHKFLGTIKLSNDQIAKIMGYGDYQMGNVTISRVYYVEGLGHNLFSVGQFCDSDLEVAFRKHTCYIRDLEGVDLLKGSRGSNLYTSSLKDMMLSSPICLLSKALKTKSWLWHRSSYIRIDNGTEFVNQTLRAYYEDVGISHQTSVARTPQQNGVFKRQNQTLVEAVPTMLIFSKALLFLWAEAVATTCYTKNRSLICKCHNKTPYELFHDKKPELSYLNVFGALCYPTNDSEDLSQLKSNADIRIFIGFAPTKKAYRIYNKRTRLIIETIHVDFDELTAMASEQSSS